MSRLFVASDPLFFSSIDQLVEADSKHVENCILGDLSQQVGEEKYSAAVVCVSHLNSSHIESLMKLIQLGAPCQYFVCVAAGKSAVFESEDAVRSALVLGGFVDIQIASIGNNHEANKLLNPSADASTKVVQIRAARPTWKTGTSASISLKAKKQQATDQTVWASATKTNAVTLNASDLIDEDSLLDDTDLAKPTVEKKAGCPPTRKACANCSCGRADRENQKGATLGDLDADVAAEPVKSACGNCALGDAFRCGSCPYLGLPPFEKGQEGQVLLDQNRLAMDL
eukprot:c12221_g2_i1.p1 GENE.c12221_g2_i1~~c12221_g2_i1.p1  ORF type:complete len:294 (+),score=90.52 c12221_g2_i1:32-883(+)